MQKEVPEIQVDEDISKFLKKVPTLFQMPAKSTEGGKRILIELGEEPKKAAEYAAVYTELVFDIASVLWGELKGLKGMELEESFITAIWGIMHSNLQITYGTNVFQYMHESVQTGKFDCDTSAFLVYDAAKQLKNWGMRINVEMIDVPKIAGTDKAHALVKTENFFFETTSGSFHDVQKLYSRYPEALILPDNQIQAITYIGACSDLFDNASAGQRSVAVEGESKLYKRYGDAIKAYSAIIEVRPESGISYYNRGRIYEELNVCGKALEDYDMAIKLNPELTTARSHRVLVSDKLSGYKGIVRKHSRAIKLNPKDADAYANRGDAFYHLGNFEKALEDYDMAIKLAPEVQYTYYARHRIYALTGKDKEAKKDYEKYSLNSPSRIMPEGY
ncbi:MAG: tetratricopeptide repeat protein [Candidatus Micrarchaeota archaeon]